MCMKLGQQRLDFSSCQMSRNSCLAKVVKGSDEAQFYKWGWFHFVTVLRKITAMKYCTRSFHFGGTPATQRSTRDFFIVFATFPTRSPGNGENVFSNKILSRCRTQTREIFCCSSPLLSGLSVLTPCTNFLQRSRTQTSIWDTSGGLGTTYPWSLARWDVM